LETASVERKGENFLRKKYSTETDSQSRSEACYERAELEGCHLEKGGGTAKR